MKKKIIIANWKMNPGSLKEAESLAFGVLKFAQRAKNVGVVLCPPFMYLSSVIGHKPLVRYGAQDLFWENSTGPFTGEISPAMLKNSGVRYAIVGHSERRKWLGETDEMVGKKLNAALAAGLTPILCVGEPIKVRREGTAAALRYVRAQLKSAASHVPKNLRGKPVVVAYEPIWAIGTGFPCNPEEAERMVRACAAYLSIKESLGNVRGIYGGSVSGDNAGLYLNCKYIDGLLVGGASLKIKEFRKTIEAAASVVPAKPPRASLAKGGAGINVSKK